MLKKRRIKGTGFTLIELLVTIAILSIIFVVGFFAINGLFGNSEDKVNKITKKMIINAAEQYAMEFKDDENWNEIISDDSNEEKFCISIESLIDYGYFHRNNKEIDEAKDRYVVVMQLKDGVYNYELVDLIQEGIEDLSCVSYEYDFTITKNDDTNSEIFDDKGTSIGNFDYDIEKIDNNYIRTKIDSKIDFEIEHYETPKDIYVILILDTSSSMIYNPSTDSYESNYYKFLNAKNAAIDLSKKVVDKLDANVALFQYDTYVSLKREFNTSYLSSYDFDSPLVSGEGLTNTSGGIDYATSYLFKNGFYGNDNVYTVLLYDGLPRNFSFLTHKDAGNKLYVNYLDQDFLVRVYFSNFYDGLWYYRDERLCSDFYYDSVVGDYVLSDGCRSYVEASSNYLKMLSKFIVVGYDIPADKEYLKKIATSDDSLCKNSSLTNYCYYNSTTTNISSVFDNISNYVIEDVRSTDVQNVVVRLTPKKLDNGEDIFEFAENSEGVSGNVLEKTITLSELKESTTISIDGDYKLQLNKNIFNCTDDECKNIQLFDMEIVLKYVDKEDIIKISNLPTVTIISESHLVLN